MNHLQVTQHNQIQESNFTAEKIELIKSMVAKDANDIELQFFIEQCKRTGLDPVTKQIYFIKDKNGKVNIQTSIDGLRLIASRSSEYQGQVCPMWCGEDGQWKDVWISNKPPVACKVGVHRRGFKEVLYAVAIFNEYNAKNYMWGNKPALMIAKVAEALALRKAFPNEMSGIYTQDEYEPEVAPDQAKKDAPDQAKKVSSVTVVQAKPAQAVVESNRQSATMPEPEGALSFDDHNTTPEPVNAPLIQSSVESQPLMYDPNYVIPIGKKYKGQLMTAVDPAELESFANWLIKDSREKGKPMGTQAQEMVSQITAYMGSLNQN